MLEQTHVIRGPDGRFFWTDGQNTGWVGRLSSAVLYESEVEATTDVRDFRLGNGARAVPVTAEG